MRCAAVILTLAFLAGSASADQVSAIEKHWRELDFDLVVQSADRILEEASLRKSERLEVLRLKGSALVVLDRRKEAVAAFERIFAIDPDYELPAKTSPRILAVYRPARAAWQVRIEERLATSLGKSYRAVRMKAKVPAAGKGGRAMPVRVELADPGKIVDKLVLSYRRRGHRHYSALTAAANPGTVVLTIPGAFTASAKDYVLELYIRARHRSGSVLRRQGGADRPLVIQMAAGQVPRRKPIYKRWWFWASVGVVAATAVTVPLLMRDVGPQQLIGVDNR